MAATVPPSVSRRRSGSDFRDLVRDLSARLRARIEMRQVGVRDEAKLVGGIGSCGRELCCSTFLPHFAPVSIKMAKNQRLVLNPTKVAGQCGRLKCCLMYEDAQYVEAGKGLPKVGKQVQTPRRRGRVDDLDILGARCESRSRTGRLRLSTQTTSVPSMRTPRPRQRRSPCRRCTSTPLPEEDLEDLADAAKNVMSSTPQPALRTQRVAGTTPSPNRNSRGDLHPRLEPRRRWRSKSPLPRGQAEPTRVLIVISGK